MTSGKQPRARAAPPRQSRQGHGDDHGPSRPFRSSGSPLWSVFNGKMRRSGGSCWKVWGKQWVSPSSYMCVLPHATSRIVTRAGTWAASVRDLDSVVEPFKCGSGVRGDMRVPYCRPQGGPYLRSFAVCLNASMLHTALRSIGREDWNK